MITSDTFLVLSLNQVTLGRSTSYVEGHYGTICRLVIVLADMIWRLHNLYISLIIS